MAVSAVAAAAGIVGTAWVVGGREGLGQIGQDGVNAHLLPRIGDPAPDFPMTIIDLKGRPTARFLLSSFQTHPVWLNFWGSWCPPCRAEMPDIVAAYNALQRQGLVWLAVSLDEPPPPAARFAALNHATFFIASDPHRADSGAAYPIANFPTHLLIDRQGVVRDIIIAAIDQAEIIQRAARIL